MKYKIHNSFLKICVLLALFNAVDCEVFSATDSLRDLLITHENIMVNLEKYIKTEEHRLNALKGYYELFVEEHKEAIKNEQLYVENPISAFTLIKRLSKDFEDIKFLTTNFTAFECDQENKFPTDVDLRGAAVAIGRLQQFYQLNTNDVATGKLNDKVMGLPLTSGDCYILAEELFHQDDRKFLHFIAEWFSLAYENMRDENVPESELTKVLRYIVLTHHQINQTIDPKAYEWSEKLFDLNPDLKVQGDLKFYKEEYNHNEAKKINYDQSSYMDMKWETYVELCRGNHPTPNSGKLFCSYLTRKPFLRLAPIKMEKVSDDPSVFLFHEVVSDEEMDLLKLMVLPNLERARVSINGTAVVIENRVGQNAVIDEDVDVVRRIRQRAADFTGLDMTMSEILQVLNYGVGGQYDLHYDASSDDEDDGCKNPAAFERGGNRIGTVLFYLSDVDQGGSTVFPDFFLTLKPKKGTAVYWRNLHHDGHLDQRMYHAGCPVLHGSKWVSNIWFREVGNELKWPCRIQPNSANSEDFYAFEQSLKLQ